MTDGVTDGMTDGEGVVEDMTDGVADDVADDMADGVTEDGADGMAEDEFYRISIKNSCFINLIANFATETEYDKSK